MVFTYYLAHVWIKSVSKSFLEIALQCSLHSKIINKSILLSIHVTSVTPPA